MPTLLEAARTRKAELEAAAKAEEARKQATPVASHVSVPVVKRSVALQQEENETVGIDGYVPSTDALRVAVKMLTGVTVRGSGADARRAIQAWKGKIPKARKQH